MTIINNRPGQHVVTLDIANNSYQLSQFAMPNTSLETVTGLTITKIWWTGPWQVLRGNTVVFNSDAAASVGQWDLKGNGIVININQSANVVVLTPSTNASILLEFGKISSVYQA